MCVFLSWQWQDVDTPLTPGWHVAAAYFTAHGVTEGWPCVCGSSDEPQTAAWAVRTIECTGEAQRQGRSSVGVLGGKASLYCRTKPNINGLEDRCVLCWEIYFPLYGVFTLAGHFDWHYGGRFSLLLHCQYCQCSLLNFDKLLSRIFPGWPADQMDGGESCNLNLIFSY